MAIVIAMVIVPKKRGHIGWQPERCVGQESERHCRTVRYGKTVYTLEIERVWRVKSMQEMGYFAGRAA